MNLYSKITNFATQSVDKFFHNLPDSHKKPELAIALSGGADSLALLHAMHLWQKNTAPTWLKYLEAIHINHQTGSIQRALSQYLCKLCGQLGIGFQAISLESGLVSEKQLRDARLQAFFTKNTKHKAFVLAHHQADRLEGFLLRLFQGTGSEQIVSPKSVAKLKSMLFLRPFLGLEPHQLKCYCRENGLNWFEDPSNYDVEFTSRNWLRHEVLPRMYEKNPHAYKAARGSLAILEKDIELLINLTATALSRLMCGKALDLAHEEFQQATAAWQEKLIMAWGKSVYGKFPLQKAREILELVQSGKSGLIYGQKTWQIHCFEGKLIFVELDKLNKLQSCNSSKFQFAWGELRFPKLADGLKIVSRGNWPAASAASLKKRFQEAAIPTWLRADWPLLVNTTNHKFMPIPRNPQNSPLNFSFLQIEKNQMYWKYTQEFQWLSC